MYLPFRHEEECDGSLTDSTSVQRFAILNKVAWSEAVDAQSVRFQNGPSFIMIHGFEFGAYVQGMFLFADDTLASICLRTSCKGGNRLAGCEDLPPSSITFGGTFGSIRDGRF